MSKDADAAGVDKQRVDKMHAKARRIRTAVAALEAAERCDNAKEMQLAGGHY